MRRTALEYGRSLASSLGKKLDKAADDALALVAPFHNDVMQFVLALPDDDKPAPKAKAKATKKGGAKSGKGKEE